MFMLAILFCISNLVLAKENGTKKNSNHPDLIIVGGDHNYPPYEFLDEVGLPTGYNTELTFAIAKVMGLNVEIKLAPWSEIRNKLDNEEIDIVQGMSYSKKRDENYDFVPHHATVNQSIFTRKGNLIPADVKALKDKEVIVQRNGFTQDEIINRNIGAKLIQVSTHVDALRLLSSGKHDFAIVANLPGLYVGKELELTNIKPNGKPFASMSYGYSVKQDNDRVYALFSEGLAILKRTGKHQEIYDKWLGSLEEESGFNWRLLSFVSAALLATALLISSIILFWNRQLTKTVNRRTEKLKSQQQQLLQADKMASLGELVSGVAHEINNPTSLLLLNSPVIKESFSDIESILETHYQKQGDFNMGGLKYSRMRTEIPKMLDDMQDRANRIRRIVRDLRDYSQNNTADLNESLNLNTLTDTAVRILSKTIQGVTNNFSCSYSQNLPQFKGNSQRIEQVLINLISNACHALTDKKQAISIRTFHDKENKSVCIEIKDEGCGIETDKLNRITEPFYTTKRTSGGTGLGLSISEGIVKEHKAVLEFKSTVQKGTCVSICFPIPNNKKIQ